MPTDPESQSRLGGLNRLLRGRHGLILLGVLVLGIGGVMYHAMGKDGWINRVLGGIFHHGLGSALAIITGIGAWSVLIGYGIGLLFGWWK